MQGFFTLLLIFGNGTALTSQQSARDNYSWEKCQAAGEFVRQQYPPTDFRFVCVPNSNSTVDAPQGLPGRDRFFPNR